ncbi:MAG TPA: transposase [Xanthobacteraceae bacterium]|nr:transposase [Xanthobacteraceae bacterium]
MRYRRVHFAGATYFFTLVTERRRPLFREAATVALFLGALQRVRSRHPFEVDAYVVLPDHLHVLWTLPEGDANFSTRWRLVKEAFTRSYVKTHGAPGRSESRRSKGEQGIWQRRFWEHTVRDETDFARHLDYIHINPVHHGLATAPRDWPHSSFHEWVQRGVYDVTWGSDALPELPDWAKRHE